MEPYRFLLPGLTAHLEKALDVNLERADIPRFYKNAPVVAISPRAFADMGKLALVGFPSGLLRIEEEAFINCIALPSIIIPSSVKEIKDRAFKGCSSLSSITLGTANSALSGNRICFCGNLAANRYGSGLAMLGEAPLMCVCGANTFQNALNSIGIEAFASARVLNLVIPEGVRTLGLRCFADNPNLTKVSLPSSLSSFDHPFEGCSNLKEVTYAGTIATFRKIEGYRSLGLDVRCIDGTLHLQGK